MRMFLATFLLVLLGTGTLVASQATIVATPQLSVVDGHLEITASEADGKKVFIDGTEIVLRAPTRVLLDDAQGSSFVLQEVPTKLSQSYDQINKVGNSVSALRTELMGVINAQKATIDQLQTTVSNQNQLIVQLQGSLASLAAENQRQQADFDSLLRDISSACRPGLEYEVAPLTATSARKCALVTNCRAGEYEITPPTVTSNRVCSNHTVCPVGSYSMKVGSGTTDAVCAPWTECKPGQYELVPPSATNDRVCKNVTQCVLYETFAIVPATWRSDNICFPTLRCKANEYASVNPTLTSDRVCAAASPNCTASQWEQQPLVQVGLSQQDRVCRPITECDYSMQYATALPTATSDRVCRALTACTSQQYQSVAPTTTSDRTCRLLTTCTSSEFQSVAPTATTDRVCQAVRGPCAVGEIETAPTPTSDRICTSPLPSQCSSFVSINAATAPSRAVSNSDQGSVTCDYSGYVSDIPNNVNNWVRFTGLASGRIPEYVPASSRCGTHASGWLNGAHPTTLGSVVTRTVCFNWSGSSCYWSTNIQITNCNSFFVYKLPQTPTCHLRYCVDA